ncbi:MAG: ACT domain-containing protein [Candidatus Gastranaerophilales bacterium]|nr:ACT domain-containing protein [Candidatus Gastranaerophilales bacterium]
MKESKMIITVSGEDKVGIVAKFANVLADYSVNIEDIKQTIMQDHFVMFVMGDLSKSEYTFQEVKDQLLKAGEELKMEVWVQRKAIFDKMHTI